jgi:hypothetical protein
MDAVEMEGWVECVRVTSRRAVGQSILGREHPRHARAQLPRDNMRAAQSSLHILMLTAALPGHRYDETTKSSPRTQYEGRLFRARRIVSLRGHVAMAGPSRLASRLARHWFLASDRRRPSVGKLPLARDHHRHHHHHTSIWV